MVTRETLETQINPSVNECAFHDVFFGDIGKEASNMAISARPNLATGGNPLLCLPLLSNINMIFEPISIVNIIKQIP
jgi:hypothetical protein